MDFTTQIRVVRKTQRIGSDNTLVYCNFFEIVDDSAQGSFSGETTVEAEDSFFVTGQLYDVVVTPTA